METCPGALTLRAYPAFPHAQTTSASVDGTVQDGKVASCPASPLTLTSRTQGNALTRRPIPVVASCFPSSGPIPTRSRHFAGLQDAGADEHR